MPIVSVCTEAVCGLVAPYVARAWARPCSTRTSPSFERPVSSANLPREAIRCVSRGAGARMAFFATVQDSRATTSASFGIPAPESAEASADKVAARS